jgi:hypothetical protein
MPGVIAGPAVVARGAILGPDVGTTGMAGATGARRAALEGLAASLALRGRGSRGVVASVFPARSALRRALGLGLSLGMSLGLGVGLTLGLLGQDLVADPAGAHTGRRGRLRGRRRRPPAAASVAAAMVILGRREGGGSAQQSQGQGRRNDAFHMITPLRAFTALDDYQTLSAMNDA